MYMSKWLKYNIQQKLKSAKRLVVGAGVHILEIWWIIYPENISQFTKSTQWNGKGCPLYSFFLGKRTIPSCMKGRHLSVMIFIGSRGESRRKSYFMRITLRLCRFYDAICVSNFSYQNCQNFQPYKRILNLVRRFEM